MGTVRFSGHALLKLRVLGEHGVAVELEFVKGTVYHPERREKGYGGRWIAQRGLDAGHVLRVVYEEHGDDLLVVTLYPARRERYETI
ncbi:MAG: DUF4258 domain-containing protein [Chloroflexota bacterium]